MADTVAPGQAGDPDAELLAACAAFHDLHDVEWRRAIERARAEEGCKLGPLTRAVDDAYADLCEGERHAIARLEPRTARGVLAVLRVVSDSGDLDSWIGDVDDSPAFDEENVLVWRCVVRFLEAMAAEERR